MTYPGHVDHTDTELHLHLYIGAQGSLIPIVIEECSRRASDELAGRPQLHNIPASYYIP